VEWKKVKLKDVCSFINGDRGKNYPSSKDFVDSGIPFINAGHLNNKKVAFDSMNYITSEKYDSLNSGKVEINDILFCLRGSLGKLAIVNFEKGAIASSLVIIRVKEKLISSKYLLHYLNSEYFKRQISRVNTGSTQPNLSATNVKKFEIPLPPIPTQIKIAAALDKAQELIDKRKEQIQQYDDLLQSVFLDMFGDPVTNPRGWEKKKLTELCSDIIDCPHSTPKYVNKKTNYPGIRTTEIKNGRIDLSSMKYVQADEYKNRTKRIEPKQGDIIYAREGSFGGAVILPDNFKFCLGQRVVLLRATKSVCNSLFLWFQINSKGVYSQALKGNIGSTVGRVNMKEIKNFVLISPPLILQNKFASIVEKVEEEKKKLETSLTELENNFNSIMQKAFRGDLF
jgi:type I restriction enzyme S subunit